MTSLMRPGFGHASPRPPPDLIRHLKKGIASVHTPPMNLKSAACLALVAMVILSVLLIATFIFDALNVLRGLIPATRLLTSLIYAFAALSAVIFLHAFHKAQS
jgi:hypothetical protein